MREKTLQLFEAIVVVGIGILMMLLISCTARGSEPPPVRGFVLTSSPPPVKGFVKLKDAPGVASAKIFQPPNGCGCQAGRNCGASFCKARGGTGCPQSCPVKR